ncbi:nucleoside hydrolase [Sinorhizobium terangae]|uniref:Nucleoside hydrolase n=1 Tax=Sinorhizobium terangae TaxID=110322 RepID=A0A6N7LLD0_SINTE|nr:nucleoside hydrolase [Sinorhizobium terangae]MQX18661.1 nucleoside hydrolase [Sinorhizobium terangae]
MTQIGYADRIRMLEPPKGRVRCVLDTDTYNEIDDQFAVVQMLLSADRLDLQAIYAAPFHNARSENPGHGMELSYDEILRLLTRMDVEPEGLVFQGVRSYVGPEKVGRDAPAVEDLIGRARASSTADPLYVVAIAAISNVASAILKAPDIIDRIVVVWLGGDALEWPDTREFNLCQDVGGAQVLFDSGVPVVLLPCLGVVSHLLSSVPEIERHVEPHGEIGKFLAQRYKEHSDDHVGWSKEIWDMAPVAWLLNPDWCESVITSTPVLTDQVTWSVDKKRHPMRYVYRVHRDPILKDFFGKMKARSNGAS